VKHPNNSRTKKDISTSEIDYNFFTVVNYISYHKVIEKSVCKRDFKKQKMKFFLVLLVAVISSANALKEGDCEGTNLHLEPLYVIMVQIYWLL